jgi:hypothetical protein
MSQCADKIGVRCSTERFLVEFGQRAGGRFLNYLLMKVLRQRRLGWCLAIFGFILGAFAGSWLGRGMLLSSRTYRTVGAEALLRWADRTDASIPTEVLVRMAEEKGHDSLKSQLTKLYVPVHTGCADRILLGKGKTELESRSLQVRRCSNRALDSARRGTDYFMSVR